MAAERSRRFFLIFRTFFWNSSGAFSGVFLIFSNPWRSCYGTFRSFYTSAPVAATAPVRDTSDTLKSHLKGFPAGRVKFGPSPQIILLNFTLRSYIYI